MNTRGVGLAVFALLLLLAAGCDDNGNKRLGGSTVRTKPAPASPREVICDLGAT